MKQGPTCLSGGVLFASGAVRPGFSCTLWAAYGVPMGGLWTPAADPPPVLIQTEKPSGVTGLRAAAGPCMGP